MEGLQRQDLMSESDFESIQAKVLESLPSRFSLAHVHPTVLAVLHRLYSAAPRKLEKVQAVVLNRLLDLTVQYVEERS